MNKKEFESLLLLVGIAIVVFLLIPEIWRQLLIFIFWLSVFIFCIVQLYQATNITKMIVYLGGFTLGALMAGKQIVYFAETIPLVRMIITIALVIISYLFLFYLIVKFGKWLYYTFKPANKKIN